MSKEFVPYELALKMKALGFDDECMAYYQMSLTEVRHEHDGTTGPFGWKKGEVSFEKRFFINNYKAIDNSNENWIEFAAPLYQQAFRWFREKHELYHSIDKHGYWFFEIKKDEGFGDLTVIFLLNDFDTYEEAERACLDKLIEIVENQWD